MEMPGDMLGEEIEFAAGEGTYTENEIVRASLCGNKTVNEKTRTISIDPSFTTAINIKVGQKVYGIIDSVSETYAMMTIFDYEKSEKNKRVSIPNESAMLRIEGVKTFNIFLKNMSEVVRVGDIVKAEVSKIERGGIDVIMKNKDLGVVKAFCTMCRQPLVLTKNNKLFCSNCNRTENRKIASSYIEVMK